MSFQTVRIVNLDSYMSSPIQDLDATYSEFRGSSISQVPVLRLFGSVSSGEKICVHIHGVFPYLYIPFDGKQDANGLIYRIATSIDKAVNISLNQASSSMQHVYKITLVQGIPMYGYHHKEHQFFKIYLYNPLLIRKVTALLMNETTLGNLYQPHEAHLNFTLQFMIDYNLHGMSNMIISKMKYRQGSKDINDDSVLLLPSSVSKMAVCELEGDCLAEDIVNREEVAFGNIGANPGIAALWADEQQRRRNKGLDSQIEHLLELKRTNLPPTNSHLVYKQALRERLAVFSNEKNVVDKLNSSVYPAETPINLHIQNASMIDSQTFTSLTDSSLTSSNSLTVGPEETSSLSITFDEDAQQLLQVLNELEKQANEKIEEDSILTQLTKQNQEEKEMEEGDLDFSMSLEAATTPTKIVPEKCDAEETSDDDLWNTTLIPQADGCCDETIEEFQNESLLLYEKVLHNGLSHVIDNTRYLKKVLFVQIIKVGRSMPALDIDCFPTENSASNNTLKTIVPNSLTTVYTKKKVTFQNQITYAMPNKTRKHQKVTRKEKKEKEVKKTLAEVKKFVNRIKKLKRQDQLAAIMKKLHNKENKLILFLEKNHQPRFRVIPKDQVKALLSKKPVDENKTSRVKVLSDIIVKIANYVEPTLHLTIKYPNHCCYLYNYNNTFVPEVTRIPRKICSSYDKEDIKKFVKENLTSMNGFLNKKSIVINQDFFTQDENMSMKIDQENKKTIKEDKIFMFSDEYLSDIKKPDLLLDMHTQSDKELLKMSENLKDELKIHMQCISSSSIKQEINFASEEERFSVLNTIKCLSTDKEYLKSSNKINNKVEDNNKKSVLTKEKINSKPSFIYNTRQRINLIEKESQERASNIKKNENKLKKEVNNNDIPNVCYKTRQRVKLICREKETLEKTGNNSIDESQPKNEVKANNNINRARQKKSIRVYTGPLRRSSRSKNIQDCLLSLDGTVDSDSSSEGEEKRKKGNVGTPSRKSRYNTLPVIVEKSPKPLRSTNKEPAVKDLVSFTKTNKKEASLLNSISQNPVCDMNVKRQLFEKDVNPLFNKTIVEEKLVCSYSPTTSNNVLTRNKAFSNINENSTNDFQDESSLDGTTTNSTDSEIHEKSFFNTDIIKDYNGLTTAETYDKNTNYKAKEGCSKFITPQSQDKLESSQNLSNSSSSDSITPYQQPKIHNLNTIIEENLKTETILKNICSQGSYKTVEENSQVITLVPNILAPTRKEVLMSLNDFKIPYILNEVPYYSSVEDVTGSVEVGFNTLKIESKTTAHLADFESQTDILSSFRKARLEQLPSSIKLTKLNLNNILLSYCKNKDCIITPVKKPPDLKTIKEWIAYKSKKKVNPENQAKRVKIRIPISPGAKSDDDELDLSLTLSPLTPASSKSSQVSSGSTPKSSTRSTSPIFGNECKKRKKQMRAKILTKSLRSSLSLSQENSINNSGQITGVSINHSYLNRSVQNLQNARAIIEHQNLTVVVMELHIRTRGDLKPDPAYDSIRAIFYSILHDVPEPNNKGRSRKGVVAINSLPLSPGASKVPILDGIGIDCDITYVDSENNLIVEFLKVIDYWDPDIFAGYEIELLSWGYLIERGYALSLNLKNLLGRTRQSNNRQKDDDGLNEPKLTGRIVLDVWRVMRHEISLQSYTLESIAYHILQKRLPYYSFKDLSFWWDHRTSLHRHRTLKYYITRVVIILELFDKLDFLGKTSELARLFGIQFFEVLSRGSQFRVESMMLRLAKPLNFIAVSPSVQQRAHMKSPEFIALVMEPESKMYNDPVIVLDFQSLYPSLIIAYNYCFTTCLGRVESLGKSGPFQFGATQLKVSRSRLKKLFERNHLNFSPCGVAFVKKEVRDGIMPRMLREILDTRLMVKNSMKENKDDKILQRVFHNRQLGLKLIANVTYGYTAANFSGRMPAVELGDSVVSKGRETLLRAVEMVDNTPEWGAKIVYGDTDSLFVLVPGKTKEEAFEVGKKIAEAVTNDNPDPIKLKLEKVYQPCILQTKKRYVGYMYESPDQKDPVYEAKGIETVRRDGCPAVGKMLEKCLKILFETKDVSLVKKYVLKQFNKIIAGRVSIQDLTFAKEFRGLSGYKPGACVPSLELAKKWTVADKRNEPRSGERVPYVIVNGPPGLPLIRLVKSPRDLLNDASLKPNAIYYITKVIIPPINRCFYLIGADLNTWFNQMPRKKMQYFASSVSPKKKSTISQYFSTSSCVSCEEQTQSGICQNCLNMPQNTVFTLMEKMRIWENNHQNIVMICQTCTSSVYEVRCTSLDCPVYYKRVQTSRDEQQTIYVRQLLSSSDF